MQKSLLFVIVLGAGIGLMLPAGKQTAPAQAARADDGAPRETVLERDGGHFYADVEINGELVHFLVDTGATMVALTEKDAKRIGMTFDREAFSVVASGAAGPVRGRRITIDRIALDGKEARDVTGAIIQGGEISLLGQAYLGQFSVEMRGDEMRIS